MALCCRDMETSLKRRSGSDRPRTAQPQVPSLAARDDEIRFASGRHDSEFEGAFHLDVHFHSMFDEIVIVSRLHRTLGVQRLFQYLK